MYIYCISTTYIGFYVCFKYFRSIIPDHEPSRLPLPYDSGQAHGVDGQQGWCAGWEIPLWNR